MDPLSIVAAAGSISATAYTIGKGLYDFISGTQIVDVTVDMLRAETEVLGRVADATKSGLQAPSLRQSAPASLWMHIDKCLEACSTTVDAFSQRVQKLEIRNDAGAYRKAMTQFKHLFNQEQIAILRAQIHTHTHSLQLITLTINLYVSASAVEAASAGPSATADLLTPKFDELQDKMDRVLEAVKTSSTLDDAVLRNVDPSLPHANEQIRTAAESIASKASVILGSRSTVWGGSQADPNLLGEPSRNQQESQTTGSEYGVSLSVERLDQIKIWSQAISDVPEREEPGSSSSVTASQTERSNVHSPPAPLSSGTADTSVVLGPTLEDVGAESSDEEMEIELGQTYLSLGRQNMVEEKFDLAEGYMRKALASSKKLRRSNSKVSFETTVMRDLAVICFRQDKLDEARSFCEETLTNAAERDGDRKLGLDALHLLAQVHLRRGDLEKATSTCKVAMSGRKKLEGKGQSYHESLSLMAYICDQRGDAIDATTYRKLLPEGFEHLLYAGPVSEMQALSTVSSVPGTRDLLTSVSTPAEVSQNTLWLTEKLEPIPLTLTLEEQNSALGKIEATGYKVESFEFSRKGALCWGASEGHLDVVKLMLKGGPPFPATKRRFFKDKKIQFPPTKVNGFYLFNRTPLYYAAKIGHETIVRLLVERGADINQQCAGDVRLEERTIRLFEFELGNRGQMSPLDIASRNERSATVRVLLQKGAKVNSLSPHGVSCLHWAAIVGSYDIVRMLVQAGANPQLAGEHGKNAFHTAVAVGNRQVAEFLLEQDGTLVNTRTTRGSTALIIAILYDGAELVDWLVSNGLDVNASDVKGQTALDHAMRWGKLSALRPLISNGANSTSLLISSVCGVDNGESALERLLDAGADPNVADSGSKTPLYMASSLGDLENVKILLRHGANVDTPSVRGASPLATAARSGHISVMEALLGAGADLNSKNAAGMTPLMEAALSDGHILAVRTLLEHGADMEITNVNGATAHSLASLHNNQPEIVNMLLRYGAKPL